MGFRSFSYFRRFYFRCGLFMSGRSVFDSPVTRPPPAPSEGPGPPPQKTKTNPFFDRYTAVTTYRVRRRRFFRAAGGQNVVFTLKIMFLRSILASRAYSRTPRMIQSRDFGFEPNYGNLVIKILFFFSTGTGSEGWAPRPPTVFCFLFSPPAHYP